MLHEYRCGNAFFFDRGRNGRPALVDTVAYEDDGTGCELIGETAGVNYDGLNLPKAYKALIISEFEWRRVDFHAAGVYHGDNGRSGDCNRLPKG